MKCTFFIELNLSFTLNRAALNAAFRLNPTE